jgi:SHS2 domain-containing protein
MPSDEFYREIEHTGDAGIELVATSRAELFRRAAIAIARLMVAPEGVRPIERREVRVSAVSDADLMHDLLAALLNLFLVEGFIWCDAVVNEDGDSVRADVVGERYDPARHELRTEIKAVTYHQLSVERVGDRWQARVIFDI